MTDHADPTIVARTERVLIRPWRLDDADRCYDVYRREEVTRWLRGKPMSSRQEAVEIIERNQKRLAADPRFGSWAVVERSSGIASGGMILKPLPDGDGEIEIGWHLHPDSWGRGLASEAASALLAYGFAGGLKEIWAVTMLDNEPSVRVCRRIGMRLLGVTHRWYHEPLLMFWAGSGADQQPSLAPEEPAPPELSS
ncbi:MAG: GNAT family N-acetyltransferase [Solirubrobacteraceae bacterium]